MKQIVFCFSLIQSFVPWLYYYLCLKFGSQKALALQYDISRYRTSFFRFFTHRYNRNLYYHRFRRTPAELFRLFAPAEASLRLPANQMGGVHLVHPWNTILNAKSIGRNFAVYHNVTIGAKGPARPIIGDDVQIFVGAIVIGGIKVGNNVLIGAGVLLRKMFLTIVL